MQLSADTSSCRQAESQPRRVEIHIHPLDVVQARKKHATNLELTTAMNSTADIIGWAPEPRGRGTIGLLWSCFATIFLCTWNAIHPHLPGLNESKFKIVRRRIAYVLLCLIAPELFAMDASIKLAEAIHVKEKAEAKVCSPRQNRS
jgi:hypothetical protein